MLQYLSFDFFLEIKVGIPAYFPAASFADLVELRGDVGAREMLRGARVWWRRRWRWTSTARTT